MKASQFLINKAKKTIQSYPHIQIIEIKECPNFYVVHSDAVMIDEGMFIDAFTYNGNQYCIYKR